MRTSCKGKWLLLQPRSGASVHQDTHFYAQVHIEEYAA